MAVANLPLTRPDFDQSEIESVSRVLATGWVTQGPMVKEFERIVAERHKARFGFATTSCTAALHLATMALGLQPGDEVIVPAFTWVTSAHAAEYVGAKAVFADVDLTTYNIDSSALEAAVTPRSKAIMAVHLFGLAAPMDHVLRIAKKHDLRIIEDAACAIGTDWRGTPVGTMGDLGCFSFHPRKIVTTGEGGLVTTNDAELARKVSYLRNHGLTGNPDDDPTAKNPWTMARFDALGFNLRLSDIQAAVGVAQMAKLDRLLTERRGRARHYSELLSQSGDFALPSEAHDSQGHSFQSYVIRVRDGGRPRRNAIMAMLQREGVQTRPGTHAVPRLGYYRNKYGIPGDAYPNATVAEDTTITLPIFPGMTDSQQARVVELLETGRCQKLNHEDA